MNNQEKNKKFERGAEMNIEAQKQAGFDIEELEKNSVAKARIVMDYDALKRDGYDPENVKIGIDEILMDLDVTKQNNNWIYGNNLTKMTSILGVFLNIDALRNYTKVFDWYEKVAYYTDGSFDWGYENVAQELKQRATNGKRTKI